MHPLFFIVLFSLLFDNYLFYTGFLFLLQLKFLQLISTWQSSLTKKLQYFIIIITWHSAAGIKGIDPLVSLQLTSASFFFFYSIQMTFFFFLQHDVKTWVQQCQWTSTLFQREKKRLNMKYIRKIERWYSNILLPQWGWKSAWIKFSTSNYVPSR